MAFPNGWNRKTMRFANTEDVFYTGLSGEVEVLLTADNLPSEMFDADGSYPAKSDGGDIRISKDADGSTQLACEIVNFTIDNNPANGRAEIWVKLPDGLASVNDSGTTSSTSSGKLIDSSQNFTSTVSAGDVVYNTTDETFALVISVDSDTQLTLDTNIMASGETYKIYDEDNKFYVWYNNSSASMPSVSDTYGRNAVWTDFKAVWHMNENNADQTDSTGNGHTASRNGTPARFDAKFSGGYCQGFDGTSEWFEVSDHADFDANQDNTIMCWAKSGDYGGEWRGVVTKNRDQSDVAEWVGIWRNNANPGLFDIRAGNQTGDGSTFTQNAWISLLFRWQYNNQAFTGYFNNGSSANASGTTQVNEPKDGSGNVAIGRALGVSEYFDGWIDEVRWTNDYRGLWKTSVDYHTFNNPANFVKGTAPEEGGGDVSVLLEKALHRGIHKGIHKGIS